MILHQIQWQCLHGASHRKNIDTPPLKGLRLEPFRFQLGSRRNEVAYALSRIFAIPFGTMVASAT